MHTSSAACRAARIFVNAFGVNTDVCVYRVAL
jgi:hypothetical protein